MNMNVNVHRLPEENDHQDVEYDVAQALLQLGKPQMKVEEILEKDFSSSSDSDEEGNEEEGEGENGGMNKFVNCKWNKSGEFNDPPDHI